MKVDEFFEKKVISRIEKLKLWMRIFLLLLSNLVIWISLQILIGICDIGISRSVGLIGIILSSLLCWPILISFFSEHSLQSIKKSTSLVGELQGKAYLRGRIFVIVIVLCVIVLVAGMLGLSFEPVQEWLNYIVSSRREIFG